ncbi:Ig-like domain-containing protein [Marinobacter sp.]|uniref:Ig-like domain-containing protein n=1 Tax=Marinobacter sp. TaxID=50741 RepID=UPI002B26DECF|nr:Ig-like domain-containing protein [Marinobacter sp.]
MKQFKTLALIPAMLLAACGGSDDQDIKQSVQDNAQSVSLVYSYPMDGQGDVSPKADLVLRFSHAIGDDDATLAEKIRIDSSTGSLAFTVTKIDGGKSLNLEISEGQSLASGESYSVTFNEPLLTEGGREISTPNAVGESGIQFTTRGDFSGIAELAQTSDEFGVAWQVPANGTAFEAANFSTFRLAMTHPVHPEWQNLGGSIELLDKNGTAVPSTVLVKGNRITVDPCVTEDPKACGSKNDTLNAGQAYTLKLNNLASLTNGSDGERLSTTFEFIPRETGPTVVLEQEAVDSNGGNITSVLNGQAINGVVLNSVLQGITDSSQQTGSLFAELAYAPSFEADEALPLRIPKGSVLESTSLNIKIGGQVQVLNIDDASNQETGTIKVTMLSDASGYMSPNAYTDDINAPRHITLFMDVSMNTAEAMPNAALSQDLMGVELRGIALVEDGVLTIDAIGMVEPNLLGQEFTDSTIAFHLQAATDVDSVLDAEVLREIDNTAPQLLSWMPGAENASPATRQSMQRPGDPVILFFDEPLDPASITSNVSLFETRETSISPVDFDYFLDGTTLTLNPIGGLKHGVTYDLNVDGVTDLADNPFSGPNLSFKLDDIGTDDADVNLRSPLALTTYPGFPCVTTAVDLSSQAPNHGQCIDAAPDGPKGPLLPITTLPQDRPIVVVFSQSMNLDSINDQTFIVERIEDSSTAIGQGAQVDGRLEKSNQRIRFIPEHPWSTEDGVFYRYTMKSQQGATCGDGDVICAEGDSGLALQTDLLRDPEDTGGPDMTIYFRGTDAVNTVFTPLRNLPIRDTNSNYEIDCDDPEGTDCLEPFDHGEPNQNGEYMPSANAAKLALKGQAYLLGNENLKLPTGLGCESGESCEKNKFIYQTYGLNTEVIGKATDPETGKEGIRVLLYPTMLATTSASVYLSPLGEQKTGPQILRMTYGESDPDNGNPLGLIEGIIVTGDNGQPTFKTEADLLLDAPNLDLPIEGLLTHNLYSYPFTLDLKGDITFFDDGRMQIEQRNINPRVPADITVQVTVNAPLITDVLNLLKDPGGSITDLLCTLDLLNVIEACQAEDPEVPAGDIEIPLTIPEDGVYLNFITNPVKDLPVQYEY